MGGFCFLAYLSFYVRVILLLSFIFSVWVLAGLTCLCILQVSFK